LYQHIVSRYLQARMKRKRFSDFSDSRLYHIIESKYLNNILLTSSQLLQTYFSTRRLFNLGRYLHPDAALKYCRQHVQYEFSSEKLRIRILNKNPSIKLTYKISIVSIYNSRNKITIMGFHRTSATLSYFTSKIVLRIVMWRKSETAVDMKAIEYFRFNSRSSTGGIYALNK